MMRCLRTTRSARLRPVAVRSASLRAPRSIRPVGLEPLQHLADRGARDAEHLRDARGERRRAAPAGGTRRSGRPGSRSSRGTRRRNVPVPSAGPSVESRSCKVALTRLEGADRARPRSLSSALIAGCDHLLRAAHGTAAEPALRPEGASSARPRPGSSSSCSWTCSRIASEPVEPALARRTTGVAFAGYATLFVLGTALGLDRASSATTAGSRRSARRPLARPGRGVRRRSSGARLVHPLAHAGALARAADRDRHRPAQLRRGARDRPGRPPRARRSSRSSSSSASRSTTRRRASGSSPRWRASGPARAGASSRCSA